MSFKNTLLTCVIFITHTSFAMHGKKQIAIQKKRMQENLQKQQFQSNRNTMLLRLCDRNMTNADISLHDQLCNAVKTLLDDGADINAQTESKYTSLYFACLNKNSRLVKLLIAYGVNVNTRITNGFVPLHVAAEDGSFDIVNMLTMAQADVNIQSFVGKQTALHLSLQKGCSNTVKTLLEHNANPNMQKIHGITPLYVAVDKKLIVIIHLLLTFGADPNIPDIDGYTPLHVACEIENEKIVEILLNNNANPNATIKKYHITPLHCACRDNNINIINMLLNKGANIHAQDKNQYTPLHWAIFHNQPEIVKILLQNSANILAQSIYHETPIHLAYRKKNPVIIDLLIEYGAQKISSKQTQKDNEKFFEHINQKTELLILIEPIISITETTQNQPTTPTEQSPALVETTDKTITPKIPLTKNITTKTITPVIKVTPSSMDNNEYLILQDKKFKWPKFLTQSQQDAIKDQLKKLKHWLDTNDCDIKALQNTKKGTYRLRVGSCRIIFFVDEKEKKIFVIEIGPRKTIYKRSKLI